MQVAVTFRGSRHIAAGFWAEQKMPSSCSCATIASMRSRTSKMNQCSRLHLLPELPRRGAAALHAPVALTIGSQTRSFVVSLTERRVLLKQTSFVIGVGICGLQTLQTKINRKRLQSIQPLAQAPQLQCRRDVGKHGQHTWRQGGRAVCRHLPVHSIRNHRRNARRRRLPGRHISTSQCNRYLQIWQKLRPMLSSP